MMLSRINKKGAVSRTLVFRHDIISCVSNSVSGELDRCPPPCSLPPARCYTRALTSRGTIWERRSCAVVFIAVALLPC